MAALSSCIRMNGREWSACEPVITNTRSRHCHSFSAQRSASSGIVRWPDVCDVLLVCSSVVVVRDQGRQRIPGARRATKVLHPGRGRAPCPPSCPVAVYAPGCLSVR